MEAIADGPRPDGVMVPMVGAALEVAVVLEKLGATLPVLPLIETARGLDNAVEIGAVSGRRGAGLRGIRSRPGAGGGRWAIVEADRGAGGSVVGMGGRMVDRPMVEAARRVLDRAGEARRAEGKPDGVGG